MLVWPVPVERIEGHGNSLGGKILIFYWSIFHRVVHLHYSPLSSQNLFPLEGKLDTSNYSLPNFLVLCLACQQSDSVCAVQPLCPKPKVIPRLCTALQRSCIIPFKNVFVWKTVFCWSNILIKWMPFKLITEKLALNLALNYKGQVPKSFTRLKRRQSENMLHWQIYWMKLWIIELSNTQIRTTHHIEKPSRVTQKLSLHQNNGKIIFQV